MTVTATLDDAGVAWPATVAGGVDGDVGPTTATYGVFVRLWGVHAGVAGESGG